jgi:pimeloyl-ACP methyl ester carboxylesterase
VAEKQQSLFFTAPDGLKLHALVLGEQSEASPVVCLPGLTRPARDFGVIAHHLHARRPRQIISIDYRGRGGSDWDPDWRHYSFPVEYADILSVLDQLGVTSAIFIGLSRGGIHSLTIGSQRPDLLKALVLNDVGPQLDPHGLARIKDYVGALPLLRDFDEAIAYYKQAMGPKFPAIPDPDWRHFVENSLIPTPERLRLSYDPQLARTLDDFDPEKPLPDLWPLFAAIKAPILALRGEHSDLLTPQAHADMAARHPHCRLHVVPGQGHTPLLLDLPTLDLIADFIDEVEGV